MHNGFKVSVLRYQPNMLLIYDQRYDWPARTPKQREAEENLTRGKYNGYMSPKTKSKVNKYLTTWVQSIEQLRGSKHQNKAQKLPYLTFVTLTLPSIQKHTDNEIKRQALGNFIKEIQRKCNVWNYFWRAEAQKNGNIHFHLIIDSFVNHTELRGYWNKQMDLMGYIEPFKKTYGHNNPNSTDIHALRNIKNPGAYLIKYVTKSEGYRPINGRIHGCSDRIRVLRPYEVEISTNEAAVIRKAMTNDFNRIIKDDLFTIVFGNFQTVKSLEFVKLRKNVSAYLLDIAIDLYSNREASKAEIEQAELLKALEEEEQQAEQMGIPFDYATEAWVPDDINF